MPPLSAETVLEGGRCRESLGRSTLESSEEQAALSRDHSVPRAEWTPGDGAHHASSWSAHI